MMGHKYKNIQYSPSLKNRFSLASPNYWLCQSHYPAWIIYGIVQQVYTTCVLKLFRYLSRFATLEGGGGRYRCDKRGVHFSAAYTQATPLWKFNNFKRQVVYLRRMGENLHALKVYQPPHVDWAKLCNSHTAHKNSIATNYYTTCYYYLMPLHCCTHVCVWHSHQNDKMCVSTATYLIFFWRCCAPAAIRHICIFFKVLTPYAALQLILPKIW